MGTSTHFTGAATRQLIEAFLAGDVADAIARNAALLPVFTGVFATQGCLLVKAGLRPAASPRWCAPSAAAGQSRADRGLRRAAGRRAACDAGRWVARDYPDHMIDFNGSEIVVLAVLAVIIFGPEKLPDLARKTARVFHYLRGIANDARGQLRAELGPEYADISLSDLNPRNAGQRLLGEDDDPDLRDGTDLQVSKKRPPVVSVASPVAGGSTSRRLRESRPTSGTAT